MMFNDTFASVFSDVIVIIIHFIDKHVGRFTSYVLFLRRVRLICAKRIYDFLIISFQS